jgi:hypothetical protein
MSTPAPKCPIVKSSTPEPMPQLASSPDFASQNSSSLHTPLPIMLTVSPPHHVMRPCSNRSPHLQSP